jgi:dCTP diphosphatase
VRPAAGTVRAVTLDDLAHELRRFAAERDWEQFHTPKNLAISLAVEVGELLEHVQWGSDAEIAARLQTPDGRTAVAEELADVLIYLVRLADLAGIDLLDAATAKLAANAARYPADEVRGSSAKRER